MTLSTASGDTTFPNESMAIWKVSTSEKSSYGVVPRYAAATGGRIPRGEIEIVMVGAEFLFIVSTPPWALPMDARRPKSG